MTRNCILAIAITLYPLALPALGATDAQKCEAAKLKVAGKYNFCLLKAEAKAVTTGNTVDYTKCDSKFSGKFGDADTKYTVNCPTSGDVGDIQSQVSGDADDVAVLLSGGTLPECGNGVIEGSEQCDGVSLGGATCSTVAANTSGTLACTAACQYDVSGCAGASPTCGNGVVEAGEDCDVGDLSGGDCTTESFAGGALACAPGCTYDTSGCWAARFVDNGDGTVTDADTGMIWEKKDDAGGIHDWDNTYTWSTGTTKPDGTAFTDFLGTLNGGISPLGVTTTGCFAGHCDWRLPTTEELQTLLLAPYLCGTNPCIDAIFGLTQGNYYRTATTYTGNADFTWSVNFSDGLVGNEQKTISYFARAVRGGL